MRLQPRPVALAHPVDIADQRPAVALQVLELDAAGERQAPLRRIGDLHQVAAHAAPDEAAQALAQRLERHEEIADQNQAGMARQLLARRQADVGSTPVRPAPRTGCAMPARPPSGRRSLAQPARRARRPGSAATPAPAPAASPDPAWSAIRCASDRPSRPKGPPTARRSPPPPTPDRAGTAGSPVPTGASRSGWLESPC